MKRIALIALAAFALLTAGCKKAPVDNSSKPSVSWEANPSFTMMEIVSTLNKEGVQTRKGGEWVISTVQGILNNRKTYEGFYRYGKENEWVKGQHEAILKPAEK